MARFRLQRPPTRCDLLFEGGRIVDGTGAPWFRVDLCVGGDRIAGIGRMGGLVAKCRIDAGKLVVAPGFIDLLGQSEISVLADNRAASKILPGITTELTGEASFTGVAHRNARRLSLKHSRASRHTGTDSAKRESPGGTCARLCFRMLYRFAEFTLSPKRRVLLRGELEVRLIPRYFDLLLLLVECRNEAVSRDEIFDKVWSDVVVSDGALTQAVRSLRRALEDDAREPRFIRTVARHGYRFVCTTSVEEERVAETRTRRGEKAPPLTGEKVEDALTALRSVEVGADEEEEAHLLEAAEILLRAGREVDVDKLERRELARALMREARWDLEDEVEVPLFGRPGGLASFLLLLRFRARRAIPIVRKRWLGACAGGALAGIAFGFAGAVALLYGPGSIANGSILVALPLVGSIAGGLGALGVGGGLAWAEALIRSRRALALVLFGSAGGGLVGGLAHFVGLYTVEGLFGRDLSPVAGGFEGVVIGAAVGFGYALATPMRGGGMATPHGMDRLRAALLTGAVAAAACVALALTGHHLGAMSLDFMAHSFPGSQVSLDPLARLLFESQPGPITRSFISGCEGFGFAAGVVVGLTTRPRAHSVTR